MPAIWLWWLVPGHAPQRYQSLTHSCDGACR
jgi:hypothetical protein